MDDLTFLSVGKKGQQVKVAHFLGGVGEEVSAWTTGTMVEDALTKGTDSVVSAMSSSLSTVIGFKTLIVHPVYSLADSCEHRSELFTRGRLLSDNTKAEDGALN
jgi:hypothetical protein